MPIKNILLLLTLYLLNACSPGKDSEDTPPPPPPANTKGRMEFKLTDDPGMFAYFKIDITDIEYNTSDDPAITTGWINITMQNSGIIDIINYSNGRELPLGSLELLPVTVKQLRIKLGTRNSFAIWSGPVGGNYAFFDMTLHPSIVNGLVIPFRVNVQANGTNRIYFDFNAATSRVQTGPTSWQLLPTVRVFEAGQVSAIEGKVFPKEAKPYVRAIYLNHTSPTDYYDTAYGYPDNTGYFKIIGLTPSRAIPDSVAGLQKVEFIPRSYPVTPYQPQEKQVTLVFINTINTGITTLSQ